MAEKIRTPTTLSKDLNIIDQSDQSSLGFNGPYGKKYLTEQDVNQELIKKFKKKPRITIDKEGEIQNKKTLPHEKGIPFPDVRPNELLARIRQLAGLTQEEIKELADFLNSLTNPTDIPSSTPSAITPDLK